MHQSLCHLPITSLLTVINAGFLNNAPHLSAKNVHKYLTPSPATSKGLMKRPRKGIRSTTPKTLQLCHLTELLAPILALVNHFHAMPGLIPDNDDENDDQRWPALITISDVDVESIAAFTDKHTRVVYNDCTRNFPFMSLDGNVCFL